MCAAGYAQRARECQREHLASISKGTAMQTINFQPHATTTTLTPWASPSISPLLGLRLERAGAELWRAIDRSGRVIGHLRTITEPEGVRFRAQRFKAATGRFLELGDFWSADEAAWCLHYSA